MDPVAATAAGVARRALARVREAAAILLRDPLFLLTAAALVVKSYMAVLLLNAPGHAALDLGHLDDYDTSVVIFVAFAAIPASFAFLLRGRARLAFYLALDGAFSALLILDLWYFRAYSTFLSILLWQEIPNLGGLRDSVIAMARPVDLLFLADLAVALPLCAWIGRRFRPAHRSPAVTGVLVAAAVVCLAVEHHRIDVAGDDPNHRFLETRWEARETIAFQSPLGYHLLDLWAAAFENRRTTLSAPQREAIRAWFASARERVPPGPSRGALRGHNLILIQVESLESFVIGHEVGGDAITPTLDRLLAESYYFPNIWDQVNEGSSCDADLMANTSVYPLRKGAAFFRFPAAAYNSLPKLLRARGYRATLAMHPDPGAYWNWKNALTAMGFDECLDMSAFEQHEVIGLGLADGDFLPQAAAHVLRLPEPFYAFMVTLTSHAPFDLPERYRELDLDEGLSDTCLGNALQAFHYTDAQIGRFVDALRAGGVLDRSVLVIYGDHSSVHRFCADEVAALQGIPEWMRDPRRVVPLIVHAPGIAGRRLDVTGGQIDIMPTVLELLGIDESTWAGTAMGRDLLGTRRDFAVLADGEVVGRDRGAAFARVAAEGLGIADLAIRGDYFRGLPARAR